MRRRPFAFSVYAPHAKATNWWWCLIAAPMLRKRSPKNLMHALLKVPGRSKLIVATPGSTPAKGLGYLRSMPTSGYRMRSLPKSPHRWRRMTLIFIFNQCITMSGRVGSGMAGWPHWHLTPRAAYSERVVKPGDLRLCTQMLHSQAAGGRIIQPVFSIILSPIFQVS